MTKLKVLIVDDEKPIRDLLTWMLNAARVAQVQVTHAADGAEALRKFRHQRPDLVFLDWHMPKVDGIQFLRQVRDGKRADQSRIVMLTGERTLGKMAEALDEAGADDYLTKPWSLEEIRGILLKHTDAGKEPALTP